MTDDFLHTLLRPARDDIPDRPLVAHAANLPRVGGFQLPRLAYFEWFGHDMNDRAADLLFQAFMIHGQLPAWGRHYARKVIELERAGTRSRCPLMGFATPFCLFPTFA